MELASAVELIRAAVGSRGTTWADFGAGEGLFTRALAALLGTGAHIAAVEQDPDALAALRRLATDPATTAAIQVVRGDFRALDTLPELAGVELDGALFANSLHFVARAEPVLADVAARLRPGGAVVVVEYDRRPASRWVPYPLPPDRLAEVADRAGLGAPTVTGRVASRFGGDLYCAALAGLSPTAWR